VRPASTGSGAPAAGWPRSLRLLTGADVEVDETGGTAYSTTAGAAPPGSPNFAMVVRFRPPPGVELDPVRMDALVAAAKPAHVFHRVQVLPPQAPPAAPPPVAPPPPGPAFGGTRTPLPRFNESPPEERPEPPELGWPQEGTNGYADGPDREGEPGQDSTAGA